MRCAFVQTYPVYHDGWNTRQWLDLENRDRWMPGIAASKGHTVELWALADERVTTRTRLDGFGTYTIELFPPDQRAGRTKFHTSRPLIEHARAFRPDVVFLKGVDGGTGNQLLESYLLPEKKAFVFIIGGEYYNRNVDEAVAVLYETERQKSLLLHPGRRFWRKRPLFEQLFRLEKSIDTDLFRPYPEIQKQYDVISVSRLMRNYKRFDALARLTDRLTVAVVGGGPALEELQQKYPRVTWLGRFPNHRLPELLNRGRVFMHAGLRDYNPRVLTEAAACGIPRVAFAEAIDSDVVPEGTGIRVSRARYVAEIESLLSNPERLDTLARGARAHALDKNHKYSSEPVIDRVFALLKKGVADEVLS